MWVGGVEKGEREDCVREADAWRADLCAGPDYGMTSHVGLVSASCNEERTPFLSSPHD